MNSILWRIAGALALTHVALMVVGIMMQSTPRLDEGRAGIEQYYADRDVAPILAGGAIEVFGFVCLVPVLVFLGRAVGRRTEAGRWAAKTAVAAGVAYVAITMGTGFAPGAASLWGTHHGLDVDTALALNDIRNFAYFLSLALLGAHAIALGLAAITDRWSPRWAGWGGLGTGVVLLAAVPGAALGLQDYATLLWLVWWIGLAVLMLRHRPATEETTPETVAVRHA
jgi:hypothetical protein